MNGLTRLRYEHDCVGSNCRERAFIDARPIRSSSTDLELVEHRVPRESDVTRSGRTRKHLNKQIIYQKYIQSVDSIISVARMLT